MNGKNYIRILMGVIFILLSTPAIVSAQLPTCQVSDTFVYYIKSGNLHQYNPQQPISATNPVVLNLHVPQYTEGLTLGNNINSTAPSPTFYTTIFDSVYYYKADTTWVNTGHRMSSVNLGSGGGYLFGFDGISGNVYRYDGTQDATLITTITDFPGVNVGAFDCHTDCDGNFYILRIPPDTNDLSFFRKYAPDGTLLHSWEVESDSFYRPSGSMAIVNNYVYTDGLLGSCRGYISGDKFIFKPIGPSLIIGDYASCNTPYTSGVAKINTDTVYICPGNTAKLSSLAEEQGDIVSWAAINGNATIAKQGKSIEVQATELSRIVLTVSGLTACGQTTTDTVVIIPVTAKVDAGADKTVLGCDEFIGNLSATLSDTTTNVLYNIAWQPATNITAGSNTLTPTIKTLQNTTYVLTVTTPANQGGCTFSDAVYIAAEKQVKAIAQVADSIICPNDTAVFIASNSIIKPSAFNAQYAWHTGDGNTSSGFTDTFSYSYSRNGKYTIALVVTDTANCSDTDYTAIEVYNCTVWLPGVFSPNGDGLNDIFRVVGDFANGVSAFEFAVYNRYGQQVFYTTTHTDGWDGIFNGAPAPVSTFYYFVKYTIPGSTPQLMSGDVLLVR